LGAKCTCVQCGRVQGKICDIKEYTYRYTQYLPEINYMQHRRTILYEDVEIGFTGVSLDDVATEIQKLRLEKLSPAAEKLIDTLQLLTSEMTLLREEVQKLKREVKYKPPIGGRGYHEQMKHFEENS